MGRDRGLGVSEEAMRDAVKDPIKPIERQESAKGPKYKYSGRNAVVVLNQDGEVITAYANDGKGCGIHDQRHRPDP
jgi:hypothetical protein